MATTFTAKKITQLRRKASKAAELPDDVPEGWSISPVDPMAVLAVFQPLRIKEGYILRAYQFREGGNGNGFVWAVPVDTEFPHPEECQRLHNVFLAPHKPPLALDNVMDAIDGDGTHWSYMCASLLAGNLLNSERCGMDAIGIPIGFSERTPGDGVKGMKDQDISRLSEWTWTEKSPRNWSPRVSEDDNTVVVTFFTFSGLGRETIFRNTDTYMPGSYTFEAERQEIATGRGGYVF